MKEGILCNLFCKIPPSESAENEGIWSLPVATGFSVSQYTYYFCHLGLPTAMFFVRSKWRMWAEVLLLEIQVKCEWHPLQLA